MTKLGCHIYKPYIWLWTSRNYFTVWLKGSHATWS